MNEPAHELAAAAVGEQDSLWIGRHGVRYLLRPYLNHAEQVPSELTMHGPIGVCGVHRDANKGHSIGSINPHKTSPQRHPGFSRPGPSSMPNR